MVPAGDPTEAGDRRARRPPRPRATSWSTAATRTSRTRCDAAATLAERGHRVRRLPARAAGSGASTNGYCLMVGGTDERRGHGPADLRRARARRGGFAHVGPVGAGHFTKMVHNGIEYGMMQAYAEGYGILAPVRPRHRRRRRRSKPWREGSVVRSWLLDLLVAGAASETPTSRASRGVAADSGEGRWTVARGGPSSAWPRRSSPPRCSPGSSRSSEDSIGHEGHRRPAQPVRRPRRAAETEASERRRPWSRTQRPTREGRRGPQPGATRSCCSAPPATSPARRSSRPSTQMERDGRAAACPVIGVASSELGRRRRSAQRARDVDRRAWRDDVDEPTWDDARRRGSATSAATTASRRTFDTPGRQAEGRRAARSSTWPSRRRCSTTSSQGLAGVGLTDGRPGRGREAVRPRPRVGRASSTTCCTGRSPRRRSSASTTSSARSRSRTCWCSASPTRCSSRCGTATSSSSVQITMAEDFGVEGRGKFYEAVGALRDVVQNHLLQIVALLAMEPPVGGRRRRAARREGAGCSARSAPIDPADVVRGQYRGYVDEPGVERGSRRRDLRRPAASRSTRGGGPACRG